MLGAVDRIIGNKFGLGQEFENGILAMGSLAMAMVGIISLAPVLAAVLIGKKMIRKKSGKTGETTKNA